jgi:epsilon-lactone hydrolase
VASEEIIHPFTAKDQLAMNEMRAAAAPLKGKMSGPEARAPFDEIMEHTPEITGTRYDDAVVEGVPGIWCRPPSARPNAAILYLHGGAYILGSARAYRHFGSQFASRTGTAVFVPDYRLAPEHKFPAAVNDALAAYRGLASELDYIAVVGDSAGGGLALVVLSAIHRSALSGGVGPVAAIAISPWTDLAVSGASIEICADTDPLLTREMLTLAAQRYLNNHDAKDPLASALYAPLKGLPPLQIHVGTEEILLDDALRFVRMARADKVEATVHVWEGMPHVFAASVGTLEAAAESLDVMAAFLNSQFKAAGAAARPERLNGRAY